MKTLYAISLIMLTACGSENPAVSLQKATNPFSPVNPGSPAQCTLPIVGQYQNNSDGVVVTIATRNGECGITLSCGFTGYLYDTGGNTYTMIANAPEGDTVGGCALPAQSTNLNGKHGQFFNAQLGFYSGIGWQGVFMPSEVGNNSWTKLF